jgi:hypothetical protein
MADFEDAGVGQALQFLSQIGRAEDTDLPGSGRRV